MYSEPGIEARLDQGLLGAWRENLAEASQR
jgi:hypothetical protein